MSLFKCCAYSFSGKASFGLWQWLVNVVNIIFNLFYNFCHICANNPRIHSCQHVRVFHLLVVLNVHWEQSQCFPAAMVCVMALLPALSITSLSVKILYLPCQCVWVKCIVQHIHSVCFGQLFLPLYSLPHIWQHFLISCFIFCFYFSCCYLSRLCGSYSSLLSTFLNI